jgi:adenylate cyclase
MAAGLAVSQERSERIARLRQFLAPQVAELVDRSGDDRLLEGHRAEVVAVFCDLRGFTAFSALARPEQVMAVLAEYHQVIGAVVTRYEATLTSFSGDGLMVLVNAPVPRPDPGAHALRMAIDMQAVVQALTAEWRSRGHAIGFGVGLAMGPATVGRIGYEGRLEYTAIGSPVNLASRLCSAADDGQVLADRAVAEAAAGFVATVSMGARPLKGYDQGVPVFAVEGTGPETPGRAAPRVPEDVSARRGET